MEKKAGKKENKNKAQKPTMTVEQLADGTFRFHGRGFGTTAQKNALLAPYGKMILNYGATVLLVPDTAELHAEQDVVKGKGRKAATYSQEQGINQQIGNARFVKNAYLNARIDYYSENKKTLTVAEYKKTYLPKLKQENDFLLLSDKFALESAIEDVDTAYVNFFEGRSGFPKFASKNKPKGNKYHTKRTGNNIEISIRRRNLKDENEPELPYLKLPKVGLVRFVLPIGKTIEDIVPKGARITSVTVTHTGDRYEASLQIEQVVDKVVPIRTYKPGDLWAVDLGLRRFGTFGNDEETEIVENPRWIKKHEKRLRRLQKALSRKQYDQKAHKGSRNWEKARLKVAKEQHKVKNQRKDFHHKKSREIADRCTFFFCEDLNIKGMMKDHRRAKSIASVGWYQFLTFVEYKLKRKGGMLLKVDRWYPSSQLCSCCGHKEPRVKDNKVEFWTCMKCGAVHDRDINAKNNVLHEGIRGLAAQGIFPCHRHALRVEGMAPCMPWQDGMAPDMPYAPEPAGPAA